MTQYSMTSLKLSGRKLEFQFSFCISRKLYNCIGNFIFLGLCFPSCETRGVGYMIFKISLALITYNSKILLERTTSSMGRFQVWGEDTAILVSRKQEELPEATQDSENKSGHLKATCAYIKISLNFSSLPMRHLKLHREICFYVCEQGLDSVCLQKKITLWFVLGGYPF